MRILERVALNGRIAGYATVLATQTNGKNQPKKPQLYPHNV